MKVSISWLKELVDLKVPIEEVVRLLPLRTIGIKEEAENFIELDMKGYNRADLLSIRGVAYEVAAITDSKVNFEEPNPETFTWANKDLPETPVTVESAELAPLYCIAKISRLKVGPSSPDWIKKLEDSGVRSINNVADVTNLIMLEYGQPSHAFDASAIKDETLIVRTAKSDETIITLDNKTRKLLPSDLLITDSEKALGLAGVMGGKNSEVTDTTDTILLEVAIFDPKTIRKTASRLNLQSEASKRFQHGLTKTRALQALDAAIRMYQDLGGKLEAITIIDNLKEQTKTIPLTRQKIDSLIDVEINPEHIKAFLEKLHFNLAPQGPTLQSWEVSVPYFRLDIEIEEDLIEEVARMYGYEMIPPQELKGGIPDKIDQSLFDLIYNLKTGLVKLGLTEVQTYSFYSSQVINNMGYGKNTLVKIANPISSETEYMRDYIWPNLLEKAAENLKYFDEVAVFEIGKVYRAKPELKEEYKLSMLLTGSSDNPSQELYQIFRNLEIASSQTPRNDSEQELFHPTHYVDLMKNGDAIGIIAEVHPRITNKFGLEKRVAILEVEIVTHWGRFS